MNRQEFFRRLEYLLRGIPEHERMDALAYYNDYFDDAGVENEQQVIRELGSPETVAQMILEEVSQVNQMSWRDRIKNMSKSTKILLVLLLVFTFPIWIGIVAGVFGGVVGLLGGLFGVVAGVGGSGIGIFFAGLVCLVVGIFRLLVSPVEGVVTIGIGALFTAISILLVLLFVLLTFQWFPTVVRAIVKWGKGILHGQEGGDEI